MYYFIKLNHFPNPFWAVGIQNIFEHTKPANCLYQ